MDWIWLGVGDPDGPTCDWTGSSRYGMWKPQRRTEVRLLVPAMYSYNILKPITRSQFISALGADNLPYVQLGAGLLIGVLMQSYSKGAALLPRRVVIPVTLGVAALVLTMFWLLFRTGASWVSVAFYVLALILASC